MSACHERGETRVRWMMRDNGLEESVQFTPGYNCPVPGGPGHGVHGMEICWRLRGPAGDVWLTIATDWIPGERYPGHGLSPNGLNQTWDMYPMAFGLGYHARAPQYEGQEAEQCPDFAAPCYSDMSYTGADEPVKRFVIEGEQAIWDALEARYTALLTPAGAS